MRPRLIVLVACVFLFSSSCLAQSVTVRLMNSEDAKPIPNKKVTIYFYEHKPRSVGDEPRSVTVSVKTDAKGEAHFSVPDPAFVYLVATANLRPSVWSCMCLVLADTADVLARGAGGWSRPDDPRAGPGEIVIRATPLTFLQRVFYPLSFD